MIKRVYLEITDVCNLNCPFCTNPKGHTFMSLEDIKRAVDSIKEITDYIYLHVLGEPTLHPDFNSILDYLDETDMNLQLVTNGTLLKQYPNILSHKCLRKLSVSLHSVSNSIIEEDYFNTIDELLENKSNTAIELRFYDRSKLNGKLKLYLNELIERYNIEITSKNNSYRLKDNTYIYFEELFKWPDINDPIVSDTGKCLGAKSQLAILHNGDVTICCLDPKGHNKIGNIKKNSLKEILESDMYLDLIKKINDNRLYFELCQKCTYRLRFSKQ